MKKNNLKPVAAALGSSVILALAVSANAADNPFQMVEFGEGITQDYAEANKWYRLAAVQGHGDAQLNLGSAYANGQGVPRNYVIAHMWLQLAAQNGLLQASNNQKVLAANMASEDILRSRALARQAIAAAPES